MKPFTADPHKHSWSLVVIVNIALILVLVVLNVWFLTVLMSCRRYFRDKHTPQPVQVRY